MQDLVSTKWVRGVGLLASLSIVWVVFVPHAFPWAGLAWASLILAIALYLHGRPTRSLRELIDESEGRRVPVPVAPLLRARRAPKGLL